MSHREHIVEQACVNAQWKLKKSMINRLSELWCYLYTLNYTVLFNSCCTLHFIPIKPKLMFYEPSKYIFDLKKTRFQGKGNCGQNCSMASNNLCRDFDFNQQFSK